MKKQEVTVFDWFRCIDHNLLIKVVNEVGYSLNPDKVENLREKLLYIMECNIKSNINYGTPVPLTYDYNKWDILSMTARMIDVFTESDIISMGIKENKKW